MEVLSSRERLDRCFRHLEVDRPGVYLRGVSETSPAHPSYQPLRHLAMSCCDLKFGWDQDGLLEPQRVTLETLPYSEDFARRVTTLHTPAGDLRCSHLVGLRGQPGLHEEFLLKTVEDAEKYLSLPLPQSSGDVSAFFQALADADDRGIVVTSLGMNPAGFVAELFGSAQFAIFSVEHRDLLYMLMQRRMEAILEHVRFLLGHGVGPYFAIAGQEYVAPPLHGPEDFYDLNVRYDRPIADLIHEAGGSLHVHCHGPLRSVLEGFVSLGADVLHPIEPPPMGNVTAQYARSVFGGHVCIEGNVQIGDMYTKSAEEIRAHVADLITHAFNNHRNLIVCPTASPYVPEMTRQCHENYAALVETVLHWHHA